MAALADHVGMSRPAFSARFTQLVGEPAMYYAVRWKMQAALTQLQQTDASLTELAMRLGYDSDTAFSRAFKRIVGIAPGAVRRKARMQPGDANAQSKSNISNSDFFLRRASSCV
ncbi:AraC family transcriptional regulator (fragment) [Paraburkholderia piptadeniae]|uniref:AraC family transcriptional regulator n=1 Tax=Paraburkholderia piptadeniae TaxID=1701573 RepID=A0A1N7SAN5_9BURK